MAYTEFLALKTPGIYTGLVKGNQQVLPNCVSVTIFCMHREGESPETMLINGGRQCQNWEQKEMLLLSWLRCFVLTDYLSWEKKMTQR